MVVGNLERLMLTTVHALMKPLKTTMKGMEYIKHERPCLTTFPNTKKRVDNVMKNNFDRLQGVWKCGQILSRVLNKSSQLNLKLTRNKEE